MKHWGQSPGRRKKRAYYNIQANKKKLRIAFKYNCNATIAMIWNVGLIWSRKSALFSLSFSIALGLSFHILNYCDSASYIGNLICIKTKHIKPISEARDTLWKSILVLLLWLLHRIICRCVEGSAYAFFSLSFNSSLDLLTLIKHTANIKFYLNELEH